MQYILQSTFSHHPFLPVCSKKLSINNDLAAVANMLSKRVWNGNFIFVPKSGANAYLCKHVLGQKTVKDAKSMSSI